MTIYKECYTNGCGKVLLKSINVREMQIKTILRYNVMPTGKAKFERIDNKCWQRCEAIEMIIYCW